MEDKRDNSHWDDLCYADFVEDLVAHDDVADVFERLQMSCLNLNLVGYLLWYACCAYGRIPKKYFIRLKYTVSTWEEEIVDELDRLRFIINQPRRREAEKLRVVGQWLRDEIAFVKTIEQDLLLDMIPLLQKTKRTGQQRLSDACSNLINYCKHAKIRLSKDMVDDFSLILCVLFRNPVNVSSELQQVLVKVTVHKGGDPFQMNLID